MMTDWIKLSHALSNGIMPGYKAILWILGSAALVLTALYTVIDLSIQNGIITGLLGGQSAMNPESISMILSICMICCILVSIQMNTDKMDHLYNETLYNMISVLRIKPVSYYFMSITGRMFALALIITTLYVFLAASMVILWGGLPQGLFLSWLTLLYAGLLLIILYDFVFMLTGKTSSANSYTTIILVLVLLISSTLRPFLAQSQNSDFIQILFKGIMPDVFIISYLSANTLVTADFSPDIFYTFLIFVILLMANVLFVNRRD